MIHHAVKLPREIDRTPGRVDIDRKRGVVRVFVRGELAYELKIRIEKSRLERKRWITTAKRT